MVNITCKMLVNNTALNGGLCIYLQCYYCLKVIEAWTLEFRYHKILAKRLPLTKLKRSVNDIHQFVLDILQSRRFLPFPAVSVTCRLQFVDHRIKTSVNSSSHLVCQHRLQSRRFTSISSCFGDMSSAIR